MNSYEGIAPAADAVRGYILTNSTKLPEHVRDRMATLAGTGTSPVDLIVKFAEAVYANRAAITHAPGKAIAAGAASLCEQFGFHGMAIESRGSKIALVLDGQTVESAPEARDEWLPAPAVPENPPA